MAQRAHTLDGKRLRLPDSGELCNNAPMPNQAPSPLTVTGGAISFPARAFPTTHQVTPQSSDQLQLLRSLPPFSHLPANELQQLADSCRFETLESGDYIAVEGDETSLQGFIVASGRLALMKSSLSGKQLVVELLAPGDMFGLLLTLSLDKLPAQLSARAQSKSRVLWVPVRSILPILRTHPTLYREFFIHLLNSLHASYRVSLGLAHERVEVRIAAILVILCEKFARSLVKTDDPIIDITRQQIADLTGTTPESAIRVTRAMQRAGLIDISHPGIVRVVDLPGLATLAEGE